MHSMELSGLCNLSYSVCYRLRVSCGGSLCVSLCSCGRYVCREGFMESWDRQQQADGNGDGLRIAVLYIFSSIYGCWVSYLYAFFSVSKYSRDSTGLWCQIQGKSC
mmetsp:Transcript_8929/g.13408  ORF Transcript_8929/g.13408 Transcript_8929/m.13408 type:complete len:106 (+) Transcript_8929:167-484(+)